MVDERVGRDVLDEREHVGDRDALLVGDVGNSESEQLPTSAVVTPCWGCGSHAGSQNTCGSRCVCRSRKPGATTAPDASSSGSPSGARSVVDLGDAAVVDADVGAETGRAGAVDDGATADEEITGVGGHGKRMPLVAPAG